MVLESRRVGLCPTISDRWAKAHPTNLLMFLHQILYLLTVLWILMVPVVVIPQARNKLFVAVFEIGERLLKILWVCATRKWFRASGHFKPYVFNWVGCKHSTWFKV